MRSLFDTFLPEIASTKNLEYSLAICIWSGRNYFSTEIQSQHNFLMRNSHANLSFLCEQFASYSGTETLVSALWFAPNFHNGKSPVLRNRYNTDLWRPKSNFKLSVKLTLFLVIKPSKRYKLRSNLLKPWNMRVKFQIGGPQKLWNWVSKTSKVETKTIFEGIHILVLPCLKHYYFVPSEIGNFEASRDFETNDSYVKTIS